MRSRQIHFRISEKEYAFLSSKAAATDEPIARVVRALIRAAMRQASPQRDGTAAVPQPLRSP
jgi:hypothetical protein